MAHDKQKQLDHALAMFGPDVREVVLDTILDFSLHLAESFPSMAAKTHLSGKNSSYSPTVTVKSKAGDNLEVVLTPRIRLPDEQKTHKLHFGADGGLATGWVEKEAKAPAPEEDTGQVGMFGGEKPASNVSPLTPAQAERLAANRDANRRILSRVEAGELSMPDEEIERLRESIESSPGAQASTH